MTFPRAIGLVTGITTVAIVPALQEAAMSFSTSQLVSLFGVTFAGTVTLVGWILHRRWTVLDQSGAGKASVEIEHIKGLQAILDRQAAEIARQEAIIAELREKVGKADGRDAVVRALMIALVDEVAQVGKIVTARYREDKDLSQRLQALQKRARDGLKLYDSAS